MTRRKLEAYVSSITSVVTEFDNMLALEFPAGVLRRVLCYPSELTYSKCSIVGHHSQLYSRTVVIVAVHNELLGKSQYNLSETIDRELVSCGCQSLFGAYTSDVAEQIATFLLTNSYKTFVLEQNKCYAIVWFTVTDELSDILGYIDD